MQRLKVTRCASGSSAEVATEVNSHSPGSIALLDENNGEFFSGDAIYDDELVDDIPGANIPVYLNTMKRLEKLDISIGHGGHGPSFGKARMQAIARNYIEDRARSGSAFR